MIDRETKIIWLALAGVTVIGMALAMCQGCAVAPERPEPYKATLRIWKCGELIEETITELEVEGGKDPREVGQPKTVRGSSGDGHRGCK